MKRNKGAIIGILIAALILVVTGCTSSNPVSPAVTDSGKDLSPGAEAILSESAINGNLIDDDIMTGIAFDKATPEIVQFQRDDPQMPDPGDQVTDLYDVEADILSR